MSEDDTTLRIHEIFHSIQGESTHSGRPCVFVRLTGCHLRCTYCDTEYAFHEGSKRTIDELIDEITTAYPFTQLVEITGGEPLLQPGVHTLMKHLCDLGRTVLIETSGACSIAECDPRVIRIVDLKTPGSDEAERNDWSIVKDLKPRDEIKFVITDRGDYEWSCERIREFDLGNIVKAILFSPVFEQAAGTEITGSPALVPEILAEWLLADIDELPRNVRLQLQLHKFIWHPQTRGV